MKKTLVEVANLDAHICADTKSLYMDGSIILTPGAKDELSKRNIAVVYGSKPAACLPGCTCPACLAASVEKSTACPEGCTCPACASAAAECTDDMDLLIAVAATLKNEYGITDLEELKKATCQVVAALKDKI